MNEQNKEKTQEPKPYYDPNYLDGWDDIGLWEKRKEAEWNVAFQNSEIYRLYYQGRGAGL